MHCITFAFKQCFMHYRCVVNMLKWCVLVGLDWAEPWCFYFCMSHVHAFFMHTYQFCLYHFDIKLFGAFLFAPLSLSLFLSLSLVALWHLNEYSPHSETLFVLGHLLLLFPLILLHLTFDSVMIKPVRTFRRTFLNAAFIQNTKSSFRIFSILTFPLSSTVGVGSHCVASRSLALMWSYMSFTPTCMDSTIQYLTLSLAFKVHAW